MKEITVKKTSMLKLALLALFAFSLVGCASPMMKPQMVDRLTGLTSASQLKPGPSQVKQAKEKVVAIVNSENVGKSLDIANAMHRQMSGVIGRLYTLDFATNNSDIDIILGSERLMAAIKTPLQQKFREVMHAKDLKEAFDRGADYAAILDLELAYEYHEDPTYKWMNFTHTANVSYLFVSREYERGPELLANITHIQKTPAAGAEANNSDFLINVKEARTKMLRKLYEETSIKIKN